MIIVFTGTHSEYEVSRTLRKRDLDYPSTSEILAWVCGSSEKLLMSILQRGCRIAVQKVRRSQSHAFGLIDMRSMILHPISRSRRSATI